MASQCSSRGDWVDRSTTGALTVDNVLSHFGIIGMKWGIRKDGNRPGTPRIVSDDASRAATSARRARTSGVQALSNRDLQDLVNRLNLERQFGQVRPKTPSEQVLKIISDTLIGVGKDEVSKYMRRAATNQLSEILSKKK